MVAKEFLLDRFSCVGMKTHLPLFCPGDSGCIFCVKSQLVLLLAMIQSY